MASRWRRPRVIVPVVVVLASGGSAAGYAITGGSGSSYRTAAVTTSDVEQTLDLTGRVALDGVTKARIAASGTVATVLVSVGDVVKVGQPLVTLDTRPLRDAVITATATLTKAQAQLEDDESSSSSPPSSSSRASGSSTGGTSTGARPSAAPSAVASPSVTSGPTSAGGPSGGGPTSGGSTTALSAQVTSALAKADQLLAAASSACAVTGPTSPPAPSASASASPDPSAAESASASASASAAAAAAPDPGPPGPVSSGGGSCTSAVQSAVDALHQAQQLQAQLSAALGRPAATGTGTPTKGSSPAPATTGSGVTRPTGATSSPASASSSGASATGSRASSFGGPTAQSAASRITTDTAAVQADQLALDQAKAALAGATLKSPVSGVVSAQPFTVGGGAGKGQAVSITTPGAADVVIDVPSSSIRSVRVDQRAHVTPDGAAAAAAGTVSAIGLLPTSSSTSAASASGMTTYPVTIHVADPGPAFVDGSQAQVSLVLASVKGALVVPSSALHSGRVDVLEGTTVKAVRVETGAVGELLTQVTSGLSAGQLVVLADLSQAVPTSSTSLSSLQRSTSGGPQLRNFGGGAGRFAPPAGAVRTGP